LAKANPTEIEDQYYNLILIKNVFAHRTPPGSSALRESEASATKRVARSGNQSLLIN